MKRTLILLPVLAAALALAASASARPGSALVVIRHQANGCHAWSVNGGAFGAARTAHLARGGALAVVDDDVMPHLLVQKSGPARASLTRVGGWMGDMATSLHGPGLMAHMGASVRVGFPKPGTYTFATRAGEDYMSGIETTGEDNVLTLKVVVS